MLRLLLSLSQISTLPAHDPQVDLSISYLLWQPTQDGCIIATDASYTVKNFSQHLPAPAIKRSTLGPTFPLQNGLECQIGARIDPQSPVELQATYRILFPKTTIDTTQPNLLYAYPLFSVIPNESIISPDRFLVDHHSLWKNNYQWVDIGIQRTTQLTPQLWITPQVKLAASWQKQNWWNNELMFTTTPLLSEYLYYFTQTFWGIGPQMGVSGEFFLYHKFLSLCFNQNLSALYGPIVVTTWLATQVNDATTIYKDTQNTFYKVQPVLHYRIGLIGHLTRHLSCAVLWDLESWIAFNNLLATTPLYFSGMNLTTFQGLTVNLTADF